MRTTDKQQLCHNLSGGAKVSYRSAAAARKIQKQSSEGGLAIYQCRYCSGWHVSSQEQRCKTIAPPSSKTLRRRLEAVGRDIAAQQRKLEQAEKRLAVEQEKARIKAAQVQADFDETARAVEVMIGRLQWVK